MSKLIALSIVLLSFNAEACTYQDGWDCKSPPPPPPPPVYIAPPIYVPPPVYISYEMPSTGIVVPLGGNK